MRTELLAVGQSAWAGCGSTSLIDWLRWESERAEGWASIAATIIGGICVVATLTAGVWRQLSSVVIAFVAGIKTRSGSLAAP
jgi:hypothetical protein